MGTDCGIPQVSGFVLRMGKSQPQSRVSEGAALQKRAKELAQKGRDHEGEQVSFLDKVMAAGLLDGDVRTGVPGLPTHRQLGIVGYAVYDGAVRDESKVLPLIKAVTEGKNREDREKGRLWNYNLIAYGEQCYSEGLASLDNFLTTCVFTLEECHLKHLPTIVQKEKNLANICFLSPSIHGQNIKLEFGNDKHVEQVNPDKM
ncbi:hypothetical protein Pelo_10962 [Pelomyxa schiedti]|nr:hypothetical protein Pelo_10962 [Pelomyxa schiedti]